MLVALDPEEILTRLFGSVSRARILMENRDRQHYSWNIGRMERQCVNELQATGTFGGVVCYLTILLFCENCFRENENELAKAGTVL